VLLPSIKETAISLQNSQKKSFKPSKTPTQRSSRQGSVFRSKVASAEDLDYNDELPDLVDADHGTACDRLIPELLQSLNGDQKKSANCEDSFRSSIGVGISHQSREQRNCTTLAPNNRSILSSQRSAASKASELSFLRRQSHKFESPDREKFRYNMIYNKMYHLLNDEGERRKRKVLGSRNLNTQAKIMITQPSQLSLSLEGQLS